MIMNIELLRQQYDELIELKLVEKLHNGNSLGLRSLIQFLKSFFVKYPPEQIENDLVVIWGDEDCTGIGIDYKTALKNKSGDIYSIIKFPAVIQILSSGDILFWNEKQADLSRLPDRSLAYYLNDNEYIYIGNNKEPLPASALNTRSYFSTPTFWDLNHALEAYYKQMAQKAVCSLISNAWTCEKRLRWRNAPEANLRDSLWNYLRSTLRNVSEVKREQTVNAENPIDIKITWNNNYARALIEIKWLGVSINELGNITSNYTNIRAVEGANQLCDYLEASYEENSELHFRGYLVVFDGRRRKVRNTTLNDLSTDDAFHYKEMHIEDIPERFLKYKCILERYFIEPVCSTRGFSA